MLDSPFPESIAFASHSTSDSTFSTFSLSPEEQTCLSPDVSPKRLLDFTLGRFCAQEALSHFQIQNTPVLRHSETREPLWPPSMVGSITHSQEWGVAAVARKSKVLGIGVDLECFNRSINRNIQRHICVPEEIQWLKSLAPEHQKKALILLFSAKEAIFKCLFPLCHQFIHFKDAWVRVKEAEHLFEFTLLKDFSDLLHEEFQYAGKYSFAANHVLSSLFLERANFRTSVTDEDAVSVSPTLF